MDEREWNRLYSYVFSCSTVDELKLAMVKNDCKLTIESVHEFLVISGYSLLAIKVADRYGIKYDKKDIDRLMALKETLSTSTLGEDRWDYCELINYLLHFGYINDNKLTEKDKEMLKEHLRENPKVI